MVVAPHVGYMNMCMADVLLLSNCGGEQKVLCGTITDQTYVCEYSQFDSATHEAHLHTHTHTHTHTRKHTHTHTHTPVSYTHLTLPTTSRV